MVETLTAELMTADQLLQMPDDGKLYELVEGVLIEVSPASSLSSAVAAIILVKLGGFVFLHKLGMVFGADHGMRLQTGPDTVRAPDVSFVRADRIPPGGLEEGFFPGAPDLAVEVLSPTDRMPNVLRKVRQYLDAGTRLVWVIDPRARAATVFHLDGRWIHVPEDGALDGGEVVPGFRLPLAQAWP